jgi:hypothetical protein
VIRRIRMKKTKTDDYSKLGVVNPWTNEKIQEAKEDEDDYREVDFDSL